MSICIEIGQFAAYTVDDDNYDYYLVRIDQKAKQAEKTEVIKLHEEEFAVAKGEWICYGTWLSMVPNTTKWWHQTNQKCVVRLQVVTGPDVHLLPMSSTNRIHSNAGRDIIQFAKEQESCWRISEEDHNLLFDEAPNRAQYDFEIDIDQPSGNSDGDDEEEPHLDDLDVVDISDDDDSNDGSESSDED